ncbi:urea carboxylase system permease [Saccharothrix ecbatanensis]|uniref:Urea carboxylase system permease n=1 Tax=Saccharothrix ecbatanensis TaxID=1105145 RepID=A0A7W9M274_9PSEU|nr:amino acid permease [Saccharothrix ecbatanensis]MBB5804719.1 urea carboxylase system permease [Saccharothrix ecbatanensis]
MSDDLAPFGYRQELRRSLGGFSAFAAGFSFVSILTTVFQLFGFGFSFGGALFFWTWPVVIVGQLLVALNFAELAARFPLAGSIYQWAKHLGTGFSGWLAGWMMLLGCTVALASAAIALQVVLPSVWSGFQLVGGDPAVTSPTGATNAVLLGVLLIVCTTVINVAGVRVMARVNDIGVAAELVGVVVLLGGLAWFAVRGPEIVVENTGGAATGGLLASALMAAYVLYGFDTAASVSEETKDAKRRAPRAVLRALLVSGVGGLLVVLFALMAAPSLTDGRLGLEGLPYVITAVFGDVAGRIFLVDVAIAVVICTLTIQTGTVRLLFAMARDGALPGSARLAKVHPRTGTPVLPAVVCGAVAIGLLLLNVGNAGIFSAMTATSVVVVYLAYLLVTVPLLGHRLRGTATTDGFSMGRWGLVVNIGAVVYGLAMVVNIAWPRAEVYDLGGTGSWWALLFPLEFVAAAVLVGWVAWRRTRRPAAVGELVTA